MQTLAPRDFPMATLHQCSNRLGDDWNDTDDSNLLAADPENSQKATLLAALGLLASRIEPELTSVSSALCEQLDVSSKRAAYIGAEILTDSGLFEPAPGPAPGHKLFPAWGSPPRAFPVQRAVFDDEKRQIELWRQCDPDFALWSLLYGHGPTEAIVSSRSHTPVPESQREGGPALISCLLDRLGIRYTLDGTDMTLDYPHLMHGLVWGARWVPDAAEHIYKTLFAPEAWMAILAALDDDDEDEEDDEQADFYNVDTMLQDGKLDADMLQGLKLLGLSVSLFLGAGLVIGTTMASSHLT